jgi:hypothetical protein
VQAGDEDDAGDLAVEQHLDVLVLGHAAGGLRTQDRGVPLLSQGGLDDLSERREDRVVQLRHHQADQAGAAFAQLGRPLVTQHVQRGQHRLAGLGGHAWTVVEDPRDGRLAHFGLPRDVGQACTHGGMVTE